MDFWEEENWQDLMIISLLIAFFSLLLYFSYFYLLLVFWKIMTENDHFPVSQRKKRINWEIIENKNPYICRWLHINLSLFLSLPLSFSLLFFFGRLFLHHEGNTKKRYFFVFLSDSLINFIFITTNSPFSLPWEIYYAPKVFIPI